MDCRSQAEATDLRSDLGKDRGSEAAERRTKAHFGREHPFGGFGLAKMLGNKRGRRIADRGSGGRQLV